MAVGAWGEWVALKHVLNLGWIVVTRNWRSKRGEIDLVAWEDSVLVFIEVRTRFSFLLQRPEESVDAGKIRRVESTIDDFICRFDLGRFEQRLDLIVVETGDLRHYELRRYHL